MAFSAFQRYLDLLPLPQSVSQTITPEAQSSDYESGIVLLESGLWRLRTARITPTKPGAFVALWRRLDDGATKYEFSGFLAPVDVAPTVNAMKAGRAVPMKFRLGGDFGLEVISANSPASVQVNCVSGATVDEVETTTTAGSSGLSYDHLKETYTYVWKTASSWAGSCRTFEMKLDDGSIHQALFKFRA